MKFYGMKGDVYEVDCEETPQIEETHGWLLAVDARPELTAKIFRQDVLMEDEEQEMGRNFRKMMGLWVPPDVLEHVVWPEDGLWDEEGVFRGYVRPVLPGYVTFGEVVRQQRTMDADCKLGIARQLIAAVKAVHRMDVLCGTLHRENILISPDYERVKLAGAEFFRFRDEAEGRAYAVSQSVYRNLDTGFTIPRVPDDLAVANHLKKLFERQLLELNMPHWERAFFLTFLNGMNNPMRRPRLEQYEELLDDFEELIKKK